MSATKKVMLLTAFLTVVLNFTILTETYAQDDPAPPPAGGHDGTDNKGPSNGGAPVGGGIGILLAASVFYTARKIAKNKGTGIEYRFRQKG